MADPIDHEQEALDLLTTQFRRPLIQALLGAIVAAFQETDDVAVALPEQTLDLDIVTGAQLLLLADRLGSPIIGGEDETRALARTWIRVNRSRGTVEDVIAVLELFPAPDFDVDELFPAFLYVTVFEVISKLHPILALVLSKTRAAGVGCGVVASGLTRSEVFRYSSQAAVNESSSTYGYGQGAYAGFYQA